MIDVARIHDTLVSEGFDVLSIRSYQDGSVEVILNSGDHQASQARAEHIALQMVVTNRDRVAQKYGVPRIILDAILGDVDARSRLRQEVGE